MSSVVSGASFSLIETQCQYWIEDVGRLVLNPAAVASGSKTGLPRAAETST